MTHQTALTSVLTTIGTVLGIVGSWFVVRRAATAAREAKTLKSGDLIDNVTQFNAQLIARIDDLEKKQRAMEREQRAMEIEMAAVRSDALTAAQEAAEWRVRFEMEHDARIAAEEARAAAEQRARELQGRLDGITVATAPARPRRATDPPPHRETDG